MHLTKIIFLGDVVGRSGREAVAKHLPILKAALSPDMVFVNVENAAAGFGITQAIAEEFFAMGVTAMTTGNHAFDQRGVVPYMNQEPRLLRPVNYAPGTPGHGMCTLPLPRGAHMLLINLTCRLFMGEQSDCPFQALEGILSANPLGKNGLNAIVIDTHGEATSEKQALGYLADGRASLVVGTHTHTPTADLRIQPKGTAYLSDLGMCGDYDSILGMKKATPLERFFHKGPSKRYEASLGEGTISGVYAELNPTTGLAVHMEPVCLGPHLINRLPVR